MIEKHKRYENKKAYAYGTDYKSAPTGKNIEVEKKNSNYKDIV